MSKICPFRDQECVEKECQLWVQAEPTNERSYTCAFAAMTSLMSRDLQGIAQEIGRAAAKG